MSYSSDLHTQYLDPAQHITNLRSVFRFDADKVYLPNMKLANLGLTGTAGNEVYAHVAGCYSVIQSIELRDGGIVIDRLDKANRYLAFMNRNNSNQYNYSIGSPMAKSDVGYRLNKKVQTQPNPLVNRTVCGANGVGFLARNEDGLGMLDLRLCFPYLANASCLDTNVFKNLSVNIEYENDIRNLLSSSTNGKTVETVRPIMIIDEVVDEDFKRQLKAENKGVLWSSVESDLVQVPAAAAFANAPNNGNPPEGRNVGIDERTQKVTNRLNAFDNKYVSKMLILKNFSNPDSENAAATHVPIGNGFYGSKGMFRERLNISLDGANLFSDGINSLGFQRKLLEDTFGTVNVMPFESGRGAVGNQGNQAVAFTNNYGSEQTPTTALASFKFGQANYFGFRVENRSSQMVLSYERMNVNTRGAGATDGQGNINNEALDLVVFGMVSKSLVINGDGSYVVSYN